MDKGCKPFLKNNNVSGLEHTTIPLAYQKTSSVLHAEYQATPTREEKEKETLRRSHTVTKECDKKYAIITHDLAVSKIARQIHVKNSPFFGQFYPILLLFSSIGKINTRRN